MQYRCQEQPRTIKIKKCRYHKKSFHRNVMYFVFSVWKIFSVGKRLENLFFKKRITILKMMPIMWKMYTLISIDWLRWNRLLRGISVFRWPRLFVAFFFGTTMVSMEKKTKHDCTQPKEYMKNKSKFIWCLCLYLQPNQVYFCMNIFMYLFFNTHFGGWFIKTYWFPPSFMIDWAE